MGHRLEHQCEHCRQTFAIERHQTDFLNHVLVLCRGTGRNMVYRGDANREYAVCPYCGRLESQWSAESRDQDCEQERAPADEVSNAS